ncbi:hypothetical protein O181_071012 [Austropuccinia psidii MF-1]|uniref:Uncharacterized protein n=1 Tax=Austropuccinia psidii MF-1 TaxID=1389203 RepID=A0A9Q3I8U0_9BASI|nr:hypothetical protein [Austropuccinia psidii MF-1]
MDDQNDWKASKETAELDQSIERRQAQLPRITTWLAGGLQSFNIQYTGMGAFPQYSIDGHRPHRARARARVAIANRPSIKIILEYFNQKKFLSWTHNLKIHLLTGFHYRTDTSA